MKAFFCPLGCRERVERECEPGGWREGEEEGETHSDQGVDLDDLDLVDLLDGVLDLPLVGSDIDDEDESVVLLDLLLPKRNRKQKDEGQL